MAARLATCRQTTSTPSLPSCQSRSAARPPPPLHPTCCGPSMPPCSCSSANTAALRPLQPTRRRSSRESQPHCTCPPCPCSSMQGSSAPSPAPHLSSLQRYRPTCRMSCATPLRLACRRQQRRRLAVAVRHRRPSPPHPRAQRGEPLVPHRAGSPRLLGLCAAVPLPSSRSARRPRGGGIQAGAAAGHRAALAGPHAADLEIAGRAADAHLSRLLSRQAEAEAAAAAILPLHANRHRSDSGRLARLFHLLWRNGRRDSRRRSGSGRQQGRG